MKINLKSKTGIYFLSFIFCLMMVLALQNNGFTQECTNCQNSIISGVSASALGYGNQALGNGSIAIGFESVVRSQGGIAIGKHLEIQSQFPYAIAIGSGYNEEYKLVNGHGPSLMIGFNSTKPTFFVAQSAGRNSTGKIGIGNITDPQAKLHIKADDNEDASLLLEPTGNNKSASIQLGEAYTIRAKSGQELLFDSPEGSGYAFENGSFRVGTTEEPQAITLYGSINAEGLNATAFGEGNTASGNYSFVAGRNSEASKSNAIVIGSESMASGGHSYVVGSSSFATGNFSYVFGGNSKAEFDFSMAIGNNLRANTGGFVFGMGRVDALLTNNIEKSLVIGFNSAYPTLFVSRTPIDQQSGRIGIGNITDPQAKLHIKADDNEDASLKLETSGEEQFSRLQFSENHEIKTKPEDNFHFRTQAETAFVFHQGDIFIEDIQKGIIMRSPSGQCWRGRVNDQGMLAFEQTTCPEAQTSQPETIAPTSQLKVYPNPTDGYVEVHTGNLSGKLSLSLMDANGKQLLEQQAEAGKNILNLTSLPSGAYILLLKQDGKLIESEKIVVR